MKKRVRLNVQGLARSSKELLGNILPPEGHKFVSVDLASGEPTVTSVYSRDKNYSYACFDGIGKEPFYRDGLLYCDDIYIMNMSRSPLHAKLIRETFDQFNHEGRNFKQQWLVDKEVITKKTLGKARNVEKMLCLAEGTLVRTSSGYTRIEDITSADRIWDGISWVMSDGAIYKGEKEVVDFCGIHMTPDHKILTKGGWLPCGQAREVNLEKGRSEALSWSEIWGLVCTIYRSATSGWI